MEDDVRSASRAGADDAPLDGATPRVLCLVPADAIIALFEKPVFADAVEHLELHVVDTENDSDQRLRVVAGSRPVSDTRVAPAARVQIHCRFNEFWLPSPDKLRRAPVVVSHMCSTGVGHGVDPQDPFGSFPGGVARR